MKGWRTIVANVAAAAVAWLNTRFELVDLSGDEQAAAVVTLLAVINLILRAVTTTGIGKSA